MKYTKLRDNAFQTLQLNAGVLVSEFSPESGEISLENILGATDGGINFTATPEYSDFGEGIDNAPTNVKEFKKLTSISAQMTGTFKTADAALIKKLIGAADISANKITPRSDILDSDFFDLWWVGDYSNINEDNEGGKAGFIAIHMMNTLSTGGFQIQSANKDKGSFAFTFTAHYALNSQDVVPYEVYIEEGKAA